MRYAGAEWQHELWGAILGCVRDGRSAYEHARGRSFFAWLAEHPEAERRFDEAMASPTALTNPAIGAAYDFSDIGTLVDVAGAPARWPPPCGQIRTSRVPSSTCRR